jgi:dihydroorotase-like cyclic amidohydrolase
MDKLTCKQFAVKVSRTPARISQMIRDGVIEADKIGDIYLIDPKWVEIVKARPERRGKGRRKRTEVAA